jgi:2-isopropylmalate synthase
MKEMSMRKIVIFDTTLRDGEQSPGCSLNHDEKVQIARQLEALKVDVMEAGFPISSPGDFDAVQAVSEVVKNATVCGLARTIGKDIEAAWGALKKARHPRIHVFCATSAIHRKFKLRKAKSEIIRIAVEGVKHARSLCKDIEFSPEDASRTEPEFLADVVSAVIEAGASTVNIPDTVGYAIPSEFADLISYLNANVPNIDDATISVHCHNDLGMGVANSLAAVMAGAGQVECTINGLGERAGNASLEEIVMAIKTRRDFFKCRTGIATRKLLATSRLVSGLTGMTVQRNKAIVGENAFAHESGIHQDGMLKEKSTYEIMTPESIGLKRSTLVLGKHSGRHAFRVRAKELGFDLAPEQFEDAFERFKVLADKKKEVYDEDLVAIFEDEYARGEELYVLESLHISSGTHAIAMATVRLRTEQGELVDDAATGDGPVDASYRAIERLIGIQGKLEDYRIRAVSAGKDAQGEVSVVVNVGGIHYYGRGSSTDIVQASALAYLNALNKAAAKKAAPKKKVVKKAKKKVAKKTVKKAAKKATRKK